jgi:hypothetical protein
MTHPKTFLLTAVLALVVATGTSACFFNDRGSSSTPQGGGGASGGGGNGGGGGTTTSSKTTATTSTTSRTDGSVTAVRTEGTGPISCGSIDSEIKVTAQGRSQWTAVAKRTYVQSDPVLAKGVTVSPASGELESGRSATVRVQGSYEGATKVFYVFVTAPNRSGSGGTVLEYQCR